MKNALFYPPHAQKRTKRRGLWGSRNQHLAGGVVTHQWGNRALCDFFFLSRFFLFVAKADQTLKYQLEDNNGFQIHIHIQYTYNNLRKRHWESFSSQQTPVKLQLSDFFSSCCLKKKKNVMITPIFCLSFSNFLFTPSVYHQPDNKAVRACWPHTHSHKARPETTAAVCVFLPLPFCHRLIWKYLGWSNICLPTICVCLHKSERERWLRVKVFEFDLQACSVFECVCVCVFSTSAYNFKMSATRCKKVASPATLQPATNIESSQSEARSAAD